MPFGSLSPMSRSAGRAKRLDQGDVHSQIVRADEALAADAWTTRSVELPDGGRERRARELPVLLGHFSRRSSERGSSDRSSTCLAATEAISPFSIRMRTPRGHRRSSFRRLNTYSLLINKTASQ
jgi:hypothetical protein